MTKQYIIKNSTAEFLTFVMDGEEDGIQVAYKNGCQNSTRASLSSTTRLAAVNAICSSKKRN